MGGGGVEREFGGVSGRGQVSPPQLDQIHICSETDFFFFFFLFSKKLEFNS